MMMRNDEMYMISFSGGRTSAYMTDRLLKELPLERTIVCFANTGKEEMKTLDFVHACDQYWKGVVHWLEYHPDRKFVKVDYNSASREGEPFAALIDKREYVPNVVWRFCTQDLKIRVIKHYMLSLGFRYWTNVVGIRYDEPSRWSGVRMLAQRERWDVWLPLVEWKITKQMVGDFWKHMPFDLGLEHYQGNCDLCFLKGRYKIRRQLVEHPEKVNWWMLQEEKTGGTFRKGLSYKQMMAWIQTSPTLFDYEDPDIGCICNVD